MTMRITMLQTVTGDGGALLTAGQTVTVRRELGFDLVWRGVATDTDNVLRTQSGASGAPARVATDASGAITGLVRPDGGVQSMPVILGQDVDVAGSRTLTGTTAEAALSSLTIPANLMGPSGALRISGWVSVTGNANTKTLRIRFGSLVLSTTALANNTSLQWTVWIRNNSTGSQRIHGSLAASQGTTTVVPVVGNVDTTQPVTLQITGQLATSTDLFTLEGVTVELLRPGA